MCVCVTLKEGFTIINCDPSIALGCVCTDRAFRAACIARIACACVCVCFACLLLGPFHVSSVLRKAGKNRKKTENRKKKKKSQRNNHFGAHLSDLEKRAPEPNRHEKAAAAVAVTATNSQQPAASHSLVTELRWVGFWIALAAHRRRHLNTQRHNRAPRCVANIGQHGKDESKGDHIQDRTRLRPTTGETETVPTACSTVTYMRDCDANRVSWSCRLVIHPSWRIVDALTVAVASSNAVHDAVSAQSIHQRLSTINGLPTRKAIRDSKGNNQPAKLTTRLRQSRTTEAQIGTTHLPKRHYQHIPT